MALIQSSGGSRRTDTLGGVAVDVVVAPRADSGATGVFGWVGYIFNSLISLLRGMKITLGYLVRPSTIVTQQYPENRETLKMFDRFRGQLRLTFDENDIMYCNGCNFCELACPNASIILKDRRNPVNNKSELDRFIWRLDSCTFCNACLQACPHGALEWSDGFEAAVYDRRLLVYTLNNYAGPPVTAMKRAKKADDKAAEEETGGPKESIVAALKETINPRERYEAGVPLSGSPLPGVPALPASGSSGTTHGRVNDNP
ncbi:MAG: 4Fe-4S binding protein [Candidatus Zixiibacteriota bacterium]